MQLCPLMQSILATVFFALCHVGLAQIVPAPLHLQHPTQDKNFHLLSAIENNPKVQAVLLTDKDSFRDCLGTTAISWTGASVLQGRRHLHDEKSPLDRGRDSYSFIGSRRAILERLCTARSGKQRSSSKWHLRPLSKSKRRDSPRRCMRHMRTRNQ
jgi:hypothetical protein